MKRLLAYVAVACSVPAYLAASGPKGLATASPASIDSIRPENLAFETAEDGTKYIALKLQKSGAAAVRVHISEMRLGAGERLFVYGADGSRAYGPFTGAGPVESGEFWSEAIAGEEVVVEYQAGAEPAADLPFRIEAIEAADAPSAELTEEPVKETRVSLIQGVPVTHEVIDGMAVYEGDILLGNAAELRSALPGSKTSERSAVAITAARYRWPNGTMPYVINASIPSQDRITNAILHWNTVMAGSVRLVPRSTEANYVVFTLPGSASTCSSYVGMLGWGGQTINAGNYCSTGNLIHEIGHAFGLWHEHTREDRDRYVTINWANIQSAQSYNFNQNISNGDDLGAYDYNSIMHYGASSFSANGLPTIVTIPAGIPIGQRAGLSTGDIAAIRALYPYATAPAPVPAPAPAPSPSPAPGLTGVLITITSNPAGQSVKVDSTVVTTPASFTWAPGSTHTIAAQNTLANGIRGTFVAWSNGGPQSQVLTTPSAPLLLKADYAIAYSVKATAYPSGTATVTPGSADSFYAAGATVALAANPAPGYCFSKWTGLIAGTPDRASLAVTKPYALQAEFQRGTIVLSASSLYARSTGATLKVGVNAASGCTWSVSSTAAWAKVTSAPSASGSGTVTVSVAPNTGAYRSAYVTVGSKLFVISQGGI